MRMRVFELVEGEAAAFGAQLYKLWCLYCRSYDVSGADGALGVQDDFGRGC